MTTVHDCVIMVPTSNFWLAINLLFYCFPYIHLIFSFANPARSLAQARPIHTDAGAG